MDGSRDALTIDAELHTLLDQAGVPGPYVMAGHSLGAMWTRVYAGQYPQDVVGVVFVDSAAAPASEPFADQSAFDAWKSPRVVFQAIPWVLYRTGVGRLLAPGAFEAWGYPADLAREIAVLQSPNAVFDTSYAEEIDGMWGTINAAAAIQDLGTLPTVILWAGPPSETQAVKVALREELAALSANSVTRFVEGSDHGSILGNEAYAHEVSEAILDVIAAAETGEPLAQ